jgi:IS605 OrfB family transposase
MREEGGSVLTFQTRLWLDAETEAPFDAFAARYGRDKRRLNALLDKGASIVDAKKLFIREGLTARHFNAIRIDLCGDRASRAAAMEREIKDKERRIKSIQKALKDCPAFSSHQKKRRLAILERRVEALKAATPRMIFGGRKLWSAQHDLEANGYANHAEWLADWRSARASEFFLVGSKDETCGNQSCQYDPLKRTLTLRLPDAYGKRVVLTGVFFAYGQEELERAVLTGTAISYRFVKKPKGWYVFASTRVERAKITTDLARGAVGLDVGPGVLAVVETDALGNPVFRKSLDLALYKKSTNRAKALIQEAAAGIVSHAKKSGKPVSIETLDFSAKKAELRERGPGYARMLSGFAYEAMHAAVRARAAKDGVGVIEVNAAYSSTIGVVKFAGMYGLSGDEGAALALARRAMRLGEALPAGTAFDRPEDRSKHVWSCWRRLGKALRLEGRHAFVAATRGSGGRRGYPAFPARAAPA